MLDFIKTLWENGAVHWAAFGTALLVAFAIIAIGIGYIVNPAALTRSFGLPLPESGAPTAWWLRLKGVRDIVSGLAVLALAAWGTPLFVGIILLVEAFIPIGDMLLVLAAKGSAKRAFGIHGVTALVMLLAAVVLIAGAR